eukprot:UN14302
MTFFQTETGVDIDTGTTQMLLPIEGAAICTSIILFGVHTITHGYAGHYEDPQPFAQPLRAITGGIKP